MLHTNRVTLEPRASLSSKSEVAANGLTCLSMPRFDEGIGTPSELTTDPSLTRMLSTLFGLPPSIDT